MCIYSLTKKIKIVTELKLSSLFDIVALIIDQILMLLYNLNLPLAVVILLNMLEAGMRNETLKCRVIAQPSGFAENKPSLRYLVIWTI